MFSFSWYLPVLHCWHWKPIENEEINHTWKWIEQNWKWIFWVCVCMAKSNCGFMMQAIKSYWNVVDLKQQLYGNQHRNWNLKIQIFLCGQKRLTYIFKTYLIYRSMQCVVWYVVLRSIASNRRFGSHWCVVLVLCFVSMQRVFIAISWNEHFLMQ